VSNNAASARGDQIPPQLDQHQQHAGWKRLLIYPGPAKVLELNPAFALQQCMDAMQRAANRAAITTEHDG
jgi:hypothetical protein